MEHVGLVGGIARSKASLKEVAVDGKAEQLFRIRPTELSDPGHKWPYLNADGQWTRSN
jgi:hypothetical protein